MIIGISGKINTGKDTVGSIIQILTTFPRISNERVIKDIGREFNNSEFKIKKFADSLKDIVCILVCCTRDQLEDRDFKERNLGEEWWYWKNKSGKLFSYYTRDAIKNSKLIKLTPRLLLQLIGTECMREIIHPNTWVNALMNKYSKVSYSNEVNWIITDLRFPNELEAIESRGFTIRVNRNPSTGLDQIDLHESETALDNAVFNYTIDNNGSLEDLINRVRDILIEEVVI